MYSYIHISIIHKCICTFISSSLLNSAAKDRQNHDKLVAIKKISHFSQKTSSAKHTLRELRLLRYLGHHPNIMCLENAMIMPEEDEVYLVMSIMDTDLHRVIQSQQSLSDQHLRVFYINSWKDWRFSMPTSISIGILNPGTCWWPRVVSWWLRISDYHDWCPNNNDIRVAGLEGSLFMSLYLFIHIYSYMYIHIYLFISIQIICSWTTYIL